MSVDDKWRHMNCGCCAGLEWGGEEPRECGRCDGSGMLFIRPTGHLFTYPGGSALGLASPEEYAKATPLTREEEADGTGTRRDPTARHDTKEPLLGEEAKRDAKA